MLNLILLKKQQSKRMKTLNLYHFKLSVLILMSPYSVLFSFISQKISPTDKDEMLFYISISYVS
jgi:hypothetical protein